MSTEKKVGVGSGVILLRDGKVLLGLRKDKHGTNSAYYGDGTWSMPGGKIDFGEGLDEFARREVKEETGIDVGDIKVFCINNDKNDTAHFITIGLLSEDFSGEPQTLEPDEIGEWKWFDLDDLPENLYLPTKRAIECYKEGNFCKYL